MKAVPKAPIEVANRMAPQASVVGASSGIHTSRATRSFEAPSERAASSSCVFIDSAAAA
ncbi:hypothetical protein D3C84_1313610 [compost metagenome]